MKKIVSIFLCILLSVLLGTGCNIKTVPEENTTEGSAVNEEVSAWEEPSGAENCIRIGKGNKSFLLNVTYSDGATDNFCVKTDKTTIGDALTDLGFVEGEQGAYGLYIKTVNGATADYDVDGTYWALYVDGNYASTSADLTEIKEGSVYEFRVEK